MKILLTPRGSAKFQGDPIPKTNKDKKSVSVKLADETEVKE